MLNFEGQYSNWERDSNGETEMSERKWLALPRTQTILLLKFEEVLAEV
jgi:hypothetical protein